MALNDELRNEVLQLIEKLHEAQATIATAARLTEEIQNMVLMFDVTNSESRHVRTMARIAPLIGFWAEAERFLAIENEAAQWARVL